MLRIEPGNMSKWKNWVPLGRWCRRSSHPPPYLHVYFCLRKCLFLTHSLAGNRQVRQFPPNSPLRRHKTSCAERNSNRTTYCQECTYADKLSYILSKESHKHAQKWLSKQIHLMESRKDVLHNYHVQANHACSPANHRQLSVSVDLSLLPCVAFP